MHKKQRYVVTTTHVDSHGNQMTKESLKSALPTFNGKRKIRLGLEHIRTFPPFGIWTNGEIFQGEDKEFYLAADNVFFDKHEYLKLDDGTELRKESFSEGNYPFIECETEEIEKLEISTDPTNFDSLNEISEINNLLGKESDLEFGHHLFGRKSELPDPETIIAITRTLAIALGVIKTKIPEKIGEAIGEDLAKFYNLISRLAIETIKRVKPANRPKNFVVIFPNSECIIELVITTHKADTVLNALTKEKLSIVESKLEHLKNLIPEKIQFIYNDKETWEFNYLLSKDGSVVGTIKSFNKRNQLYNKILQAQEKNVEEK